MPIYIYQGNKQISTNAIRNNKVVKTIYVKEQGKDVTCVWGVGLNLLPLTYTKDATSVIITGLRPWVTWEHLIIPETIDNLPVTQVASRAFKDNTNLKSIELPNSLKDIGDFAFSGCTGLTSVTIPDSVTSIGYSAFSNTLWYNNQPDGLVYAGKVAYKYKGTMPSNTSIVLKEGTLGITDFAFYYCSELTSITIPDSVTSIGNRAFYDCKGLTSIIIPDSVTSIGYETFYNCTRLTSVTIGNGVTSIGYWAFGHCTGFTSITFNGTKAQWNAISKSGSWDAGTGNYTIHCTDGDIPKS